MTVKPTASDLPVIILGKGEDMETKTYIYSDEPGANEVEIQVSEAEGKYYYKYKTSYETYPKNYASEKIQFKPIGNSISLDIMSMARNNDKDLSGLKLSVINNTKLPFIINVENDDTKTPRVKLVNQKGNVSLN